MKNIMRHSHGQGIQEMCLKLAPLIEGVQILEGITIILETVVIHITCQIINIAPMPMTKTYGV